MLEYLQAIEKAYSDPQRLALVMSAAVDAEEAVAGLRREFGFSDDLGWTVTDQQLMSPPPSGWLACGRGSAALIGEDTAASDDPERP